MIQIIQEIGTPASYIFSKSVINTRTKKSSETDGSEDFSLLFAPFSLGGQILACRECLIGQLSVFVVNVQVALEGGFEVDVDG